MRRARWSPLAVVLVLSGVGPASCRKETDPSRASSSHGRPATARAPAPPGVEDRLEDAARICGEARNALRDLDTRKAATTLAMAQTLVCLEPIEKQKLYLEVATELATREKTPKVLAAEAVCLGEAIRGPLASDQRSEASRMWSELCVDEKRVAPAAGTMRAMTYLANILIRARIDYPEQSSSVSGAIEPFLRWLASRSSTDRIRVALPGDADLDLPVEYFVKDGWGTPFQIEVNGAEVRIVSAGSDRKFTAERWASSARNLPLEEDAVYVTNRWVRGWKAED